MQKMRFIQNKKSCIPSRILKIKVYHNVHLQVLDIFIMLCGFFYIINVHAKVSKTEENPFPHDQIVYRHRLQLILVLK